MKTEKKKSNPSTKKSYAPKAKKKFVFEKKPLELKPADEVKALFRAYFRKNSDAGHIMTKESVIKHVLSKLNAKEDDAFAKALKELVTEGFIEVQSDGLSLCLTQKGSDSFS